MKGVWTEIDAVRRRQQLAGLEARPPSKPTDSLRDRLVGDPKLDSDRVIAPALDTQSSGYASKTLVRRRGIGLPKNLLQRQRSQGASSFASGPPLQTGSN